MIIYWLRPELVDVVRVLHGAMDVIKHVDPDEG